MMDTKEFLLQQLTICLKNGTGTHSNSGSEKQQLAEELHKTIIRKFRKREEYSSFKDNIGSTDLTDMQLIKKYDKPI